MANLFDNKRNTSTYDTLDRSNKTKQCKHRSIIRDAALVPYCTDCRTEVAQ
jgi:hypothetical protein